MSADDSRLVITYILPRAEDPAVFDHLASFRKGPTRTNRLKSLVKNGLMHERLEARGAAVQPRFGDTEALSPAIDPGAAVMDQMFQTVER